MTADKQKKNEKICSNFTQNNLPIGKSQRIIHCFVINVHQDDFLVEKYFNIDGFVNIICVKVTIASVKE